VSKIVAVAAVWSERPSRAISMATLHFTITWMVGTFHKVSKKYLALYVTEVQSRYNNRENADIFGTAIFLIATWMETIMAITPSPQTVKKLNTQKVFMWNISSSLADTLLS
jgi:hypothetical protein